MFSQSEIANHLASNEAIRERMVFVDGYEFPQPVIDRFLKENPLVSELNAGYVIDGFKDFCMAFLISDGRMMVGMPSYIVDQLWHVFLIYTKSYNEFCQGAFGRFMHHCPDDADENSSKPRGLPQETLVTWKILSALEGVERGEVPTLFEIDSVLNVPNGKSYLAKNFINLDIETLKSGE